MELIGGLVHRESARPGAGEGGHDRRRADRGADRPRPDDPRAQALGLPRPAPPAALRPAHRAGEAKSVMTARARVDLVVARRARRHVDRGARHCRGHARRAQIVALGAARRCCRPPSATIDATGKYVLPGAHRLPRAPRPGVRRLADGGPLAAAHAGLGTTPARSSAVRRPGAGDAAQGASSACARRRARSRSSTSASTSS